jgi:50S ribosomal protein L16 3-hydroxylase
MRVDHSTPLLGGLSPAQFMRRYWHKRPYLIRGAVPPHELTSFTGARLAQLAERDDVESRLIRQTPRWSLEHGPFSRLPARRTARWTVLVQGMNLVDEAAARLMERFRFVPEARLDDVMASYATDGGGVGPHFDSYDVFLLQAQGRRRWRIGAQADLSLRPGLPLKILERFEPQEEWILEPGDMLYLPPQLAHDGVALGECVTISVGFRAPALAELAGGFLGHWADELALEGRYRDPRQPATDEPGRIPPGLADALETALRRARWKRSDLDRFVGIAMSEPKPQVVFDPPPRPLAAAAFWRRAAASGLQLDRRSLMLYDARHAYLNGEAGPVRPWKRRLADERRLLGAACARLARDPAAAEQLYDWYRAGWLHPVQNGTVA